MVTSTTHKPLRGPRGGFVLCTGTAKARYTLEDRILEQCRGRCADLLGRHPLYPGIEL